MQPTASPTRFCRRFGKGILSLFATVSLAHGSAPGHDSVQTPEPLPDPMTAVLEVTLSGATPGPEDPVLYPPLRRSVWYSWLAPASGTLLFSVDESLNLTPVAWIFQVQPDGTLGNAFSAYGAVPVNAGDSLRLMVGDFWGPDAPVTLRYRFLHVPANDSWSQATVVPGDESPVVGYSWGATQDAFERSILPTGTQPVWHVWTAPADGRATVLQQDLEFSTGPLSPTVFRGGPGASVGVVIESPIDFPVTAGETISIATLWSPPTYTTRVLFNTARLTVEPGTPITHGTPALARVSTTPWDREVREVEFLVDDLPLGRDDAAPYSASLETLPLGTHAVAARVIRRDGEVRRIPPQTLEIRPTNDSFASAALLSGESATFAVLLAGATSEPGEPTHGGARPEKTVWWRWTAPYDGGLRLMPEPSEQTSLDAFLAIYTGTGLDNLRLVGGGMQTLAVRSGETYWIAVSGYSHVPYPNPSWMKLAFLPVAPNDAFADAIPLSGNDVTVSAYAGMASRESGEPLTPSTADQTLWWQWTAPAAGTVTLSASEGSIGEIFSGDKLSTLTVLGESLSPWSSRTLLVSENLRIFLRTRPQSLPGEVGFRLQFTPAPANDAFANAQPLEALRASLRGSLALASSEEGEPRSSPWLSTKSVWYRWSPPSNGRYFLAQDPKRPVGSPWPDFGSADAEVFTGIGVRNLTSVARAGQVFEARSDTSYWIGVFSSWFGGTEFAFTLFSVPSNDALSGAIQIPPEGGLVEGYTVLSSAGEDPVVSDAPMHESVWYRWIPAGDGIATLTLNATPHPRIRIFSGDAPSLDTTVPLEAVSPSPGRQVIRFPIQAQQPLWILVEAGIYSDADGGWFELSVAPTDLELSVSDLELEDGAPVIGEVRSTPESGRFLTLFGGPVSTNMPLTEGAVVPLQIDSLPPGRYQILAGGTNAAGLPVYSEVQYLRIAPTNDAFASATEIRALPALIQGTGDGADSEPGEPLLEGQAVGWTRWWTWTAPSDGVLRLIGARGVGPFEGDTVSSLTPLPLEPGDEANPGAKETRVRAGVRYHFMAAPQPRSWPNDNSDIDPNFVIGLVWVPPNDRFADRVSVSGPVLDLTGDHAAAGTESDDINDPNPQPASVWYTWVAPADGWLTLEESVGDSSRSASVYSGPDSGHLRKLSSTPSGNLPLQMPVTGGVHYEILLMQNWTWNDFRPSATWKLRWYPTAANDDFASRTPVNGLDATLSGMTLGTSREAGEEGRRVPWDARPIEKTVWFTWTAPASGWARLEQDPGPGAVFFEAFEGDLLMSLRSLWPPESTFQRLDGLDFLVEAGRTYSLWVGADFDHPGPFQVRLLGPRLPSNDRFENALTVEGTSFVLQGTTRNATLETEETDPARFVGTESVWYRWIAPARGFLGAGSSYWSVSGWEGDSLAQLRPAAGEPFLSGARTVPGGVYFLRVTGEQRQPFEIPVEFQASPANDDFADALPITVNGETHVEGAGTGASAEAGESQATVWWRWRAPASGRLIVSLDTWHPVDVVRGTSAVQFVVVAPGRWDGNTSYRVVMADSEYYFRVAPSGSAVSFRLQFLPDPPSSIGVPMLAGDGIRIPLRGPPGRTVTLEQSTNLRDWTPALRQWLMFPEEELLVNAPSEPVLFFRPTP